MGARGQTMHDALAMIGYGDEPAVLILAEIAALATLFGTSDQLPARVASHFNGVGRPDGWMSREGYLRTMAAFEVGLPLFILGVFAGIRYLPNAMINMPHREYWLAEERRDATLATMFRYGAWIAGLTAALFCGINLLVVNANASQPVRLGSASWILLGAFVAATLAWLGCFYWRFRITGDELNRKR